MITPNNKHLQMSISVLSTKNHFFFACKDVTIFPFSITPLLVAMVGPLAFWPVDVICLTIGSVLGQLWSDSSLSQFSQL